MKAKEPQFGSHSPLGKLSVEKTVTNTNKGIDSERKLGIEVPRKATRKTLVPKRM